MSGVPGTGSAADPQRAQEVSEEVAIAVGAQRKQQQRAKSKASIAGKSKQPLPVAAPKPDKAFRQAWRRSTSDLSEEEQRKAVLQALEVFRQLPAASSYAQHRIKVFEKALELLDKAASKRSAEEKDELQQLLSQLKI